MADGFGIAINQGDFNVIQAMLKQLPDDALNKATPRAVRKGMEPVLRSAQRRVPVETGQLFQSLALKFKKYKRSQSYLGMLGPLRNFKDEETGRNPANYAHLVELGTAPHKMGDGLHPGTPPRPFLRPALDTKRSEALAIMTKELRSGLQRALKRLARKRGR
jgi:HK97 gp10 family phage protein